MRATIEKKILEEFNQLAKEVEINFEDLSSKYPKVKYGFAKHLLAIAEEDPARLYPHFDFFVKLLDHENKILKWTALSIIGFLARVDTYRKIDPLMNRMFGLLQSGNLIIANHTINALARVAGAKPEYQKRVTKELLKVEHYDYETDECRNIAIGKVVLAIGSYFNQLEDKKAVIEFVKRQIENPRNATKKKAEQFLKKVNS